jgi:GNAT superfamily N-acetyltransferase
MFSIRDYEPTDARAVRELHVQVLSAIGALFPGPWDEDFDHIIDVYVHPGGAFLVGELDGALVAMGALRRIDSTTGELKRMRVLPGLQRRGYGQQILDALEQRARERGVSYLELDTTTTQIAAKEFYAKNRYTLVGRREAVHACQLLFRKELSGS